MFAIYQIINRINKKSYIGFTSQYPPNKRWKNHVQRAHRGATTHLHCAIRKMGEESFEFCILEEGWDPRIGKDVREPYWISVLKPEYNHTSGGEGTLGFCRTVGQIKALADFNRGKSRSMESRKRQSVSTTGIPKSIAHKNHIRKSLLGITLTEERRKKISDAHRGKVASEETKHKMSIAHKGKTPWNKGKRMYEGSV